MVRVEDRKAAGLSSLLFSPLPFPPIVPTLPMPVSCPSEIRTAYHFPGSLPYLAVIPIYIPDYIPDYILDYIPDYINTGLQTYRTT